MIKKTCYFLVLPRFTDRDDIMCKGLEMHQVNSYHGILCEFFVEEEEVEKELERIFLRAFPSSSFRGTTANGGLDRMMMHSSWQFPKDRRFEFVEK